MDINGLNVGCFTAETKRDGKVFFEFVTSNHPDLRKKPVVGIRVFAGTPSHPVFKVMVIVPEEKEDVIRELIKQKTRVLIKFENDNFVDIYDIVPRYILV